MTTNLFIVFLRRPGKDDGRSDPYWEFGSFGCTGCHHDNLLNPKSQHVKAGDRLAFVQGGSQGCKLLLITPLVRRVKYGTIRVEVRWDKAAQPICYDRAPVVAAPGRKNVALAELGKLVNAANRTTAQAKLASCFRNRCLPLESKAAAELIRLFEVARRAAKHTHSLIKSYTDALPRRVEWPLSFKDRRRELSKLRRLSANPQCRPKAKGCNK